MNFNSFYDKTFLGISKLSFFKRMLIIMLSILLIIDICLDKFSDIDFWENILVEAHGMLMDIILFGVLLTIYEEIKSSFTDINNLATELDELSGYSDQAAARETVSLIHKLLAKGYSKIWLHNHFIEKGKLFGLFLANNKIENSSLMEAKIFEGKFKGSKISYSNFKKAEMNWVTFEDCEISNTDFSEAEFKNTIFIRCKFTKVNFLDSKFIGKNLDRTNNTFDDFTKNTLI